MAPRISLQGLLTNAATFVSRFSSQIRLSPPPIQSDAGLPSCPIDGPISCRNDTPVTGDTCCFVHPSGRYLLTQFWDQEAHVPGAEEDWTLHGLWLVSHWLTTSPRFWMQPGLARSRTWKTSDTTKPQLLMRS